MADGLPIVQQIYTVGHSMRLCFREILPVSDGVSPGCFLGVIMALVKAVSILFGLRDYANLDRQH